MGFLFFGKRKQDDANTFPGSAIFEGFTDWHCHILPGVDDGVRTMEESLAILAQYEEWGVRNVWLTPHIMEDMPNTTQGLRERFEELKGAYEGDRERRMKEAESDGVAVGSGRVDAGSGSSDTDSGLAGRGTFHKPVELHLAAENMLDNLFEERLASRDLLPIGSGGDHLLVETSYFNPPMNLYEILQAVRDAGYQPIIAHPERYVYMEMRDYERLKGMNIKFQMNLFSQADRYGREVKKKVNTLIDKHYYSYMGTDLHRKAMLDDVPELKFRSIYL